MNVTTRAIKEYTCDATVAWRALNGICAIFKPAGISVYKLRETLLRRLCDDLNNMNVRPPGRYVTIEGDTTKPMKVIVHPNYADDPLVVGPRYQVPDIRMKTVNHLSTDTSGVLLCGLNRGVRTVEKIRQSKPTRFYKVKGIFGHATDNYFKTGRIVEKSTHKHINKHTIDKFCASMQSSHQKKMFELCGVDIQSQAAYELAVQGTIRPTDDNIPVIYAIKCIDFTPPEFTLEIVSINEYELYLKSVVHEIGLQLRSTATCTGVFCWQYGLFDAELALLSKFWNLETVLNNLRICDRILEKNSYLLDQTSSALVQPNVSLQKS